MKLHADHAKTAAEPLVVTRIVHCGQSRSIRDGADDFSRSYRIEPRVTGTLCVTYHASSREWSVTEDLGSDYGGRPLVSLTDLTEFVTASHGWLQMEEALATYFQAPVCEFHADSPDSYRVKSRPRLVGGAGG